MKKELAKKIGDKWSNVTKENRNRKLKLRWWQSPFIIRHVNRMVNGELVDGLSQGLIDRTKELLGGSLPLRKGISVGCGNGAKEMNLIRQNVVASLDLFELSEVRIADGVKLAKKWGLADRVWFMKEDALDSITEQEQYDMVHWNNSLHHMFDVYKAVEWSKKILKKGGLFYMDDFVGPSRFQWSDKSLEIASKVRDVFLSTKYLTNPRFSMTYLPTKLHRPDPERMISNDPSEAADSERILDAVQKYFPNAEIKITGGVIYHLALSDMLSNFDDKREEDRRLLKLLMIIDELCVELGETHYATALAIKES